MLDVDHFKRFNDTFGHEAGDLVLREIGALLPKCLRASDIASRFGGEEFALVLPGSDLDGACAKAEAIREAVAALDVKHPGRVLGSVTVSAGVAAYPAHGGTSTEVLRAADAALYRAKASGRDQVTLAPALAVTARPPR